MHLFINSKSLQNRSATAALAVPSIHYDFLSVPLFQTNPQLSYLSCETYILQIIHSFSGEEILQSYKGPVSTELLFQPTLGADI